MAQTRRQVLVVHGGHAWATRAAYLEYLRMTPVHLDRMRAQQDWKATLGVNLANAYDVLTPRMPCSDCAHFEEWALWFSRVMEHVGDEVVLVGHSLGGLFLAKYLAERDVERTVAALFLVAAPWTVVGDKTDLESFALPHDLSRLSEQVPHVYVYHSEDDPVVPVGDANKYCTALPRTVPRIFTDRGHFNAIRLPELEADIQAL